MKTFFNRLLCLLFVSIFFLNGCKPTSSAPAAATSSSYPAAKYYGNRWNNEYVRMTSDQRPSGTYTLNLRPPGTNAFVMPVCKKVISEFGMRNGRKHEGIDITLKHEEPVYCAFDGMVRVAMDHRSFGKYVVVRHENGLETLYSHLNSIAVKQNQRIRAGTKIGGGGKTGNATTEHLHFEIRFMGEPINPRLIIDFEKCKLQSNTVTLKF